MNQKDETRKEKEEKTRIEESWALIPLVTELKFC
jgi:hypothetical protein